MRDFMFIVLLCDATNRKFHFLAQIPLFDAAIGTFANISLQIIRRGRFAYPTIDYLVISAVRSSQVSK